MLCWSWQHTTERLLSTIDKIHSSTHPSYTKILTLLITCIKEIRRTFSTLEKFITWMKFIPKSEIACLVYVKLKLLGKIITLLQQTWNSVVSLSSHKLYDRVLRSLSLCSFPLFWCTLFTFWITQLSFGRPLWPSPLGSRLVRLMAVLALVIAHIANIMPRNPLKLSDSEW